MRPQNSSSPVSYSELQAFNLQTRPPYLFKWRCNMCLPNCPLASITLDNKFLLTLCFWGNSSHFLSISRRWARIWQNSKLATVSKKYANVYYVFKKYVQQTYDDKSALLFATSLCLSLVSVMKVALSKYIYWKWNTLKDFKILHCIASAHH